MSEASSHRSGFEYYCPAAEVAARALCLALGLALGTVLLSPERAFAQVSYVQTEEDAYSRYELLEPSTQSFRIVYDVSASAPGADTYFNPIRKGSTPKIHRVLDLRTGKSLEWSLVTGTKAVQAGLADADPEGQYLRIALGRPVPALGAVRLRIDKTYRDPLSYTTSGERIVFERSLGVRRNSVVLPAGYELVACNVPSQVAREGDGRLRISFMAPGPDPVSLRLEGRPLPAPHVQQTQSGPGQSGQGGQIEQRGTTSREEPASARTDFELGERAFEDREIVYFLEPPETHSFRLYHDYTESRAGIDRYVNVVRPGSRAFRPSARDLDTGAELRVETLRGEEIAARGISADELDGAQGKDVEVVVIWFEPVAASHSVRLRIEETYTDPGRYGLHGDELLWDRSLGRPRNTVVLPEGWFLTTSFMPAVVDTTDDGRVRLYFENDRPDELAVLIRARRR